MAKEKQETVGKAKSSPAKTKKTAGEEKPSLVSLVAAAGKCYASLTSKILEFSRIYATAGELYGQAGRKAIQDKFPLYTASSWTLVDAIGEGKLLPQFFLCSRHFANGILRLEDSLDKQMQLLGMSKDARGVAKVEVVNAASGKVELKAFDELSRYAEDSILFALSKAASAADIRKFAREYRRDFLRRNESPVWEKAGEKVKINRKFSMDLAGWKAIGEAMGWTR